MRRCWLAIFGMRSSGLPRGDSGRLLVSLKGQGGPGSDSEEDQRNRPVRPNLRLLPLGDHGPWLLLQLRPPLLGPVQYLELSLSGQAHEEQPVEALRGGRGHQPLASGIERHVGDAGLALASAVALQAVLQP